MCLSLEGLFLLNLENPFEICDFASELREVAWI